MQHHLALAWTIGIVGVLAVSGCRQAPPPPRTPVPEAGDTTRLRGQDELRPLPESAYDRADARRYEDVPLLTEPPPEQGAFLAAYQRAGQPRITVFVNRTLDGHIIPVQPTEPVRAVEHRREATDGVTVERREIETRETRRQIEVREQTDRFESDGPAVYREITEVYLRPGEYDEVAARSLDYEALENILSDWLASGGQVRMISPTLARQRLSDEQLEELEMGRPQVLRELAQQLDADVLVQVQARPTRQTGYGLEVRVIAEAIRTHDGRSIGRAVVDIPPPLEKTQMNYYTRFLARKLMEDMGGAWRAEAR